MWELVRYGNRDQIKVVVSNGRLRPWQGWPVDGNARALLDQVRDAATHAVDRAPIYRVHPVSEKHRERTVGAGDCRATVGVEGLYGNSVLLISGFHYRPQVAYSA